MKSPRILTRTIAIFLAPLAARAATFTWDGGGADDNILTAANWNPNAVPVSSATTTDLVFEGTAATPTLTSAFSAKSVTFTNASSITIFSVTGTPALSIGAGGITNGLTQKQIFDVPVTFVATTTGLTTNSDGLTFKKTVNIGSGTINNSGNSVSFLSSIAGTGTLNQNGFGTLSFKESFSDFSGTLRANGGGLSFSGDDGTTQSLSGTGLVSVAAGANLTVNGGHTLALRNDAQIAEAVGNTVLMFGTGALRLESGGDLVVGGNFTISHSGSASTNPSVVVTGAGSTIQTGAGTLTVKGGAILSLQNGGSAPGAINVIEGATLQVQSGASAAGLLSIGAGTAGSLAVDGAGSTINSSSGPNLWGSSGGSATVTFSNAATATFPSVQMAGSAGVTTLAQVLSGAVIGNSGVLSIAGTTTAGAAGSLVISGAGSAWNQSLLTTTTIGAASGGAGTLTVSNGGTFTTGSFATTIGATGMLNLDGGTLNVGGGISSSGAFNFTAGVLNLTSTSTNLTVGTGGLLGQNFAVTSAHQLTVGGTTTIDLGRTLTLNGGVFRTGALVNNGAFDFQKGTLGIIGASGLNIGTGALGANVVLGSAMILQVSGPTTIAGGASLTLNGGAFTGGTLNNLGTMRVNLGAASAGAVTNSSGGRIFVGDTLTTSGAWTNAAGATLTLENGGLVNGAGAIANSGLVNGDGTIAKPFTNASGGEVRGDLGRTLVFTGTVQPNAGTFSLQGGTLEFTTAITNSATGFIAGHGALRTAGFTNQGTVAVSGGNADLFGDVTLSAGAKVITSGGAVTTFFDDVIHNGTEIRTSAGSGTVFFGAVSGAGPFTGTGTVYFEGDLRPGNSPASVLYEGDLVFGGGASLTLEIGGLTLGAQYDHLTIGGTMHADGDLVLALLDGFTPQFGDTFDLLDVGSFTGDFDSISAPALGGGNAWDFTNLKTTGSVAVVPESGNAALLLTALAVLGLRRRSFCSKHP